MNIARPQKLSHSRTILYEIDTLRHTAKRLETDKWSSEFEQWECLESFLVHFRNLIEFFGRPDPKGDDLNVARPETFWKEGSVPTSEDLSSLKTPALWQKYEGRTPKRISRYLQHCTEQRTISKSWNVKEMFRELHPLTTRFEDFLIDKTRPWKPVAVSSVSGPEAVGTPTVTKHDILQGDSDNGCS